MVQSFQQDCIALAMRKLRRGEVDRRSFLAGLAALGALPAALPGEAGAQAAREMVMVNWGGLANDGFANFYAAPFLAKNPGWKIAQDSSGPSIGKIRSMVESGRVTWDLCDSSATGAILLGGLGLANKIDYAVVKKEDAIGPSFTMEYGAAPYSFSSVLVYDTSKFPNGGPQNWADFWDVKKFPGTRLLRKDALTSLDAAILSLGKDPKSLYPLDVKAALARLKDIRRNAVYWTNGAESEQFMRTGEAVMGCLWHTRAKVLFDESKGKLNFTWNQGFLQPGIMVSPRGNPGGAMVQQLLASMMNNAEAQVGLLKFLGNGPTNPRAAALVPEEFKRFNPTETANLAMQVALDGEWWGKNYQNANAEFLDVITG
jgi:putative spermidine/putrescine transport system substrate-binding protein